MFDRAFSLRRGETADLRECRRCGTAVGEGSVACPECESTEIATYSF